MPKDWIPFGYGAMSFIIAISAGWKAGWVAGLDAIGTATLVTTAAGYLNRGLFHTDWKALEGERNSEAWGLVVASFFVMLPLAYWLSNGFSIHFFGLVVSGTSWGAIGFVISFFCADRHSL